jgi:long-chain acyl-CoA synthetase
VVGGAVAADEQPCIGMLAGWAADRYGPLPAQRYRRDGRWLERSYADLAALVRQAAGGLRALGLGRGDPVALLAETRPEWTVLDLAIGCLGAVCVPVHPSTPPDECARLLGATGVRAVVCADDVQRAKIASVRGVLPDLRHILVIDGENPAAVTLTALLARSPQADAERDRLDRAGCDPDEVAAVMHTAGTTGPPKPCPLTHRNWRTVLAAVARQHLVRRRDVVYLPLPLSYVFARIVQLGSLQAGATLVYPAAGASGALAELAEVRPTGLPSTPRLFENVYAAATAGVPAAEVADAVRLGLAVRARQAGAEPLDAATLTAFDRAELRLFAPVRDAFGGRLAWALSSAAPVAVEVLDFLAACGVPLQEAYGLTESTGLATANVASALCRGTVGRPLRGVDVRIDRQGEVLLRGGSVFAGYPDRAESGLSGGWLHTGDLGQWDADGYLRITGRSQDVIVTASGGRLSPAGPENHLRRSWWISHAVVHGDRSRPYPAALITLDAERVLAWARGRGLPDSLPALVRQPEVVRAVQRAVDVANGGLPRRQRIRRFAILDHDFSVGAGELTPVLRPRRGVIAERYSEVLDRLYASGRRDR